MKLRQSENNEPNHEDSSHDTMTSGPAEDSDDRMPMSHRVASPSGSRRDVLKGERHHDTRAQSKTCNCKIPVRPSALASDNRDACAVSRCSDRLDEPNSQPKPSANPFPPGSEKPTAKAVCVVIDRTSDETLSDNPIMNVKCDKATISPMGGNEEDSDDDNSSMCSTLSGNAEFWMREDDIRRKEFIEQWDVRYGDDSVKASPSVIPLGSALGSRPSAKSSLDENKTRTSSPSCSCADKTRFNCLSKLQIDNVVDVNGQSEVDDKIENLKGLSDQLKKSLLSVKLPDKDQEGWHRVSLTVDSGACDTVADPRSLPGYPLLETEASKSGEVFMTAAGDPIPQLGEKKVVVLIGSGDVRTVKAQCSIVSKPLLSVKQMIAAGQFVGFCFEGGFVFDPTTRKVDWFREEGGNYMLDTWLVPHDKAEKLVEAINRQGFTRPSR